MYRCSETFHTAVQNDNPQKALLIFSDCVFTNDDINVENGIEFSDNFNLEEDLCIGQTPSNQLTFSLFNDDRLLNDYEFGEFTATLGVLINESSYSPGGATVICDGESGAAYTAHSTAPYLRKNGSAVATQPSKAITSMLAYGGKLYCFGDGGYSITYNESNMSVTGETANAFMLQKAERHWYGKGMRYRRNPASDGNGQLDSMILTEWKNGTISEWEFCPLGVFNAERPKAPNVIEIDFTCYDRMQEFEIDMPSQSDLNNPTTLLGLFTAMCDYVGVPYSTDTFTINWNAAIDEWPEEFDNSTMRTVLGWIAEAAGSNARFDRDGKLKMDWVRATAQSYDEGSYSEFLPYWYETEKVTKLYNRDTATGEDTTTGSGSAGYLIQDNPLLKGVS